MAIDGLIILDNVGRPIIQSGFRSSSVAYPLIHIDAVNNALAKANRPEDVDPVLHIPPFSSEESPSACCHVECQGMRFLCPVSGDVDPLFAFAFLQTFIQILQDYFGTVSAVTLKENFDVVYQLLEETLDSGGHPLTTSPNALRDIVLPPSLLSKLLSVTGANINSSFNATSVVGAGPFTSPIPWRKAGLRYNNNEIYFDIVEDLKAVVNKNGTALSSNVWGKVEANAKLSGTPDILLTFTNPHVLTDCAFHPCVRLQRWTRDKSLSFIPPDGRFNLLDYRFSPTSTSTSTSVHAKVPNSTMTGAIFSTPGIVAKDTVPVPLAIKTIFETADSTATLDFTLTPRLAGRALEDIVVELNLGTSASALKFTVAHSGTLFGSGRGGGGGGEGASVNGASWVFDHKRRVLKWEIPKAPPSSSWTLRGSYSSVGAPRPAHALQISFAVPSYTFSALKVDQLRVSGEGYKPYKGVRGRAVGHVEWRW